jgi:peptidyl-prolyl cis-trans isomerase C
MISTRSRVLLVCTIALLTLSACDSKENAATPAVKDEVVATVNGKTINKSRVDMILQQSGHAGQADSPEARQAITDQLIMQMLIAEEATKKGLDKSKEVVEQLDLVKLTVLSNAYVMDYIKTHQPSDQELKAEYDRIKASIGAGEYKARHILVATEAEASDIIAKLRQAPGDFEKLAMEKSMDPGSKANGGDLGWFEPGRMVPEFGAALAKMQKGQFSDAPVKTQYGYHVILLEDTKPIEAPAFEVVKPQLAEGLQQQNLKKQMDEIKAKAKIEMPAAAAPAK